MKQVAIPKAVYTGSCNQLFDFLAEQLADFIKEQEAKHKVNTAAAAACTATATASSAAAACTATATATAPSAGGKLTVCRGSRHTAAAEGTGHSKYTGSSSFGRARSTKQLLFNGRQFPAASTAAECAMQLLGSYLRSAPVPFNQAVLQRQCGARKAWCKESAVQGRLVCCAHLPTTTHPRHIRSNPDPVSARSSFLQGPVDAALPVVGFCFSFAVEQQALNSGKLMGWTKGFDVDGVVGRDVVQLMSGARLTAARAA
jgi:hypothetical protein